MSRAGLPANDPLRLLPPGELDALLEDMIQSWPIAQQCEYLKLEPGTDQWHGKSAVQCLQREVQLVVKLWMRAFVDDSSSYQVTEMRGARRRPPVGSKRIPS